MPIQIAIPVGIVGLIFLAAGIAAYLGLWRSWVLRSRRPWEQGTGFASFFLGVALLLIVGGQSYADTLGDLSILPGILFIILAIVMIMRMPQALAPRWFRDQQLETPPRA